MLIVLLAFVSIGIPALATMGPSGLAIHRAIALGVGTAILSCLLGLLVLLSAFDRPRAFSAWWRAMTRRSRVAVAAPGTSLILAAVATAGLVAWPSGPSRNLTDFYAAYQADEADGLPHEAPAKMVTDIEPLCRQDGRYLLPQSQEVVDANALAVKYFCPDRDAQIRALFVGGFQSGVSWP